ncbi:hypothetical protein BGZ76_003223 [Entomortierella beljakovae]|nr:hypothetical protein BGZ76_003223 [Entomortierella beljakovae]
MTQPERRRPAGAASAGNSDGNARQAGGTNATATTQAPQQQDNQSLSEAIKQMIFRAILVYMVVSFFTRGKNDPSEPAIPAPALNNPNADVQQPLASSGMPAIPAKVYPLWQTGTISDIFVYVSEDYDFKDFDNKDSLVWRTNDVILGDWSDERVVDLSIIPSKHVQNNGTLYAHIYVAKHPAIVDPSIPGFSVDNRVYVRKVLTRYFAKKKEFKVKKLVGGKAEEPEQKPVETTPQPASTIVSYWHQNLTFSLLADRTVIPYAAVPPELRSLYQLESTGMTDGKGNGFVLPTVFVNDFWLLKEHMTQINETVKELPLRINFFPISYMKLQLYSSLEVGMKQQSGMMGGTGGEMDEVKRMLIDTNPYLLALTVAVSILHSAFEFLAFKNDISFWKNKKGTGGLSVRAIFLDIAQQIIVFLYLMDNNQETSYMILFGQGIGLLIEIWKVKKALKVTIVPNSEGPLPYRLHFDTSEPLTDLESKTKEYDEEAFKYLTWAAFPLLGSYAVYSVLYQEHKSWYSFVVSTLVGFVYTFGFIKMTPQLFINYKLKSVAHMPFRTMMYKSLNTFIDDLFSFVIKMPMMHRLACLRDDVVFFIYLYQRWAYRTDHTRANEFGQVGEEEGNEGEKAAEKAPVEASESKKDK